MKNASLYPKFAFFCTHSSVKRKQKDFAALLYHIAIYCPDKGIPSPSFLDDS